jgi:hypothetical protein
MKKIGDGDKSLCRFGRLVHVRRKSNLGDDVEKNLITLCREYHCLVHGNVDSISNLPEASVQIKSMVAESAPLRSPDPSPFSVPLSGHSAKWRPCVAGGANQKWGLDFIHNPLAGGRAFWVLIVVDAHP